VRYAIQNHKKAGDTSHYENVQFEVPEGWAWVKLKDVFELNPKNDLNDETSVSFIPMSLISDGFANKHTAEIRKWKEIKKGFTHFREGDVGVAKITPCFENRKSVVFRNLENGYGAGTTELHILRPILESYLSNYLIWFVKTEDFITNGVNCFTGAVGQQRIGKNIVEETYFPLPSLSEQRRIVSVIESAFALIDEIETNKLSLTQFIKQSKSKVLDLAIRGKLVPQDPNDEPASMLLEKIGNEQKTKKNSCDNLHYPFEVPEGWVWKRISNISKSIQYGYTGSAIPVGKYKMLRITDIQDNSVDWGTVPFVEIDDKKAEVYLLSNNDIVFARTGATVGKSFLIQNLNEKSVFASYLIRIKLKENLNVQYVKYFFESAYYWEQIEDKSVGIGQPNVNGTLLSELQIPIPPSHEQKRIVSKIEKIFTHLDEIEITIKA